MPCPNCRSELPIQYGFCSSCGAFVGSQPAVKPKIGKIVWPLALLVVTGILGLGYFWIRTGVVRTVVGNFVSGPDRSVEVPIVHGGVVPIADLHGHGKLYFVPVGKQAIS